MHISKRRYGSLQRSFALPDDADDGKVTADFAKGVLKVSIGRSKKPNAATRQITVKTG
ncbi:MAG: Hsp20 family protein [Rhodospirillaceae bacterium]|nr:Hsp20 family protein [Rhodospirillaceae bacterium]